LVLRAEADAVLARPAPELLGINFIEIKDWQGLAASFRARLEVPTEALHWSRRDWLDRGWRALGSDWTDQTGLPR
jgi:hypothetical protein